MLEIRTSVMQEEYNEAVVKAAEYEHRIKQKQMSID